MAGGADLQDVADLQFPVAEGPGLGFDDRSLYSLGLCYAAMYRPAEAERVFLAVVQNYRGSEEARAAEDRLREQEEG